MLKLVEKTYDDEDINAMINVLKSDKFTMGDKVKEFELEFSKKFNFNYSVMVNSGSSANLLALSVLCNPKRRKHLKKGDRVLVPAVCWSTSVFPIVQNGLIPVFVDTNPETLNINAEDINKYQNIKGIVLVHILGNSTNMDKVMEIVKEKDLIVLEDTCESLSSKYNNIFLGGFGDMGTFSFYFSHHMTTIEGGMITCKTEEDYKLLLCLRAHGWNRSTNEIYEGIDNRFCFINFGYNFRPMETQGAMGLVQLRNLDRRNANRTKNYNNITYSILNDYRNYNIFTIAKKTDNCSPQWFAIVLFISKKYIKYREHFMKYLETNGIDSRPVVTGNFTRQPVIKMINKNIDPLLFSGADIVHTQGIYIGCPTFKIYSKDEIQKITDILYSYENFNLKIPFFNSPYKLEKSIPYVTEAINSSWISLGGKYVDECQNKLKNITGCNYILLTLTGTAAIHCMIKCLKYKYPNCKKIYIPNNTYIALINMLLHEFDSDIIEILDVDITTLNIEDVSNLEKNAALFVVHNIGGITNIPKIKRERPDLLIFEDNAEGYLGKYENKKTGSLSIASSISFNMNKNFTSGQGGAFCTNDKDLFNYISSYTRHGFTGKKFHYQMVGNNYRMTNVTAAILLSQLEQEEKILQEKKNTYNIYKEELKDCEQVSLQYINPETTNSYWNIVVRVKNNKKYKSLEEKLNDLNIETRPMFLPIQEFSHLKHIKYQKNTNSVKIHNEYIFVPFNKVKKHNIKYICECLKTL